MIKLQCDERMLKNLMHGKHPRYKTKALGKVAIYTSRFNEVVDAFYSKRVKFTKHALQRFEERFKIDRMCKEILNYMICDTEFEFKLGTVKTMENKGMYLMNSRYNLAFSVDLDKYSTDGGYVVKTVIFPSPHTCKETASLKEYIEDEVVPYLLEPKPFPFYQIADGRVVFFYKDEFGGCHGKEDRKCSFAIDKIMDLLNSNETEVERFTKKITKRIETSMLKTGFKNWDKRHYHRDCAMWIRNTGIVPIIREANDEIKNNE